MGTDPFDWLAREVATKSVLRLEQVTIASVSGKLASVTMRGATVNGVEFIGTPPAVGTRVWVIVDRGAIVGLAGGSSTGAPGVTDHGALTGLADDDHPQYLKPTEVVAGARITVDTATTPGSVIITGAAPPTPVTDHGALTGLGDDDHPQYLKPTEVLAGARISVDTTTLPGSVIVTGAAPPAPITDHGGLTGLTDDDHPQYLKPAEVLAGANVTVDTATTPGSVIIGSSGSSLAEVYAQPAPPGPTPAALVWLDSDDTADPATGISAVPIGAIIAYGGSTAPTGWHLCDGSAHGSTALQSVIGSATTPNLRDRFIAGAGSSYAVGAVGGEATHVITPHEMPSHAHGGATTVDSPDHTHQTMVGWNEDAGNNWQVPNGSGPDVMFNRTSWMTSVGANARHTHSIYAEGGNGAHENRPPFYALTYIIRKA